MGLCGTPLDKIEIKLERIRLICDCLKTSLSCRASFKKDDICVFPHGINFGIGENTF